jgi:hypothetical protein
MASGIVAALIAVLALGFVEGWRRFYPSKQTWLRLRRVNGRRAVRAMRERFESAADRKSTRVLAASLLAIVPVIWVLSVTTLDSRWYEALRDVIPYAFVAIALLRMPGALRTVAARMREYEKESGDDEGEDDLDNGSDVIAL